MSVRTRVSFLTAASVAAALLLTGCGGPSLPGFSIPASTSSQAVLPGAGSGAGSGGGSGSGDTTSSDSGGSGSGGSAGGGGGAFNADCLGVASAYSTIALALLPALGGATGTNTNADQLAKAIAGLNGTVPAALKGDFQTLGDAAKSATGKSLADAGAIFGSPAVTAASNDIDKWITANCGG